MQNEGVVTQKQPAPLLSGSVLSMILRLGALALIDAFTVWFVVALIGEQDYLLAAFFAAVTIGINAAFLIEGLFPYRWFAPGLALLIIMLIYPTVFTIYVAFTNYRDGNLLTRSQAERRFEDMLYLPEDSVTYSWTVFRATDDPDTFALWLIPDSERGGDVVFAEVGSLTPAEEGDLGEFELDDKGIPTELPGWERQSLGQIASILDSVLSQIEFGEEGNIIKFNPSRPQQAGVFRQRYSFNDDGSMFDNQLQVRYETERGTFQPVEGPYVDDLGNVAARVEIAGPLDRFVLNDDNSLLDTNTEVLYDLDGDTYVPVQGPFLSADGEIAINGSLAEPLDDLVFEGDDRLMNTSTGAVYEWDGVSFQPVDAPFRSQGGFPAINGEPAPLLEDYTLEADGTLVEVESGARYEWTGEQYMPADVADDAAEPLTRFTYDVEGNTLEDETNRVIYQLVDGELVVVDAPFSDVEGDPVIGADLVVPLETYELQDEGALFDKKTGVTYAFTDGVYEPVDSLFRDAEGALAYDAQIVEPLTEYTLNDDGTLFNNKTRMLYEQDIDGVLQPIDGPFKDADGNVLQAEVLTEVRPGYYVPTGFDNFRRLFENERIRGPFVRVFLWTIGHAFFAVFLTFSFGLLLAIVLNAEFMPGRAVMRTALLVPYAIPAFISVLVWRGLLNEQLGVVNKAIVDIFGVEGPRWTSDPLWVKIGILLVQLWLGFPYMLLITTGALQSIPKDIYEAARVDGASVWQQFWSLTLPLLLVAVGPLLIASFAFNFNNFTIVELFADGGPPISPDQPAGHSDILITYTYELAFGSGRGADYGFASTISIVIFILVATITFFNFRLTQRWEEISENV